MQCFYINLENDIERKNHMETLLTSINLNYERFNAIKPNIEEIKSGKYKLFYEKASSRIKSFADKNETKKRFIGIFGCYLSHFIIHKKMIGNKEPYMIIEDDIKMTKKTLFQLNKFIKDDKFSDWDIIRSTWNCKNIISKIKGVHKESKFSENTSTHNYFGGSHFGVFKNAEKISNYLVLENLMSIDSAYSTSKLNVYIKKLDVSMRYKYYAQSNVCRA